MPTLLLTIVMMSSNLKSLRISKILEKAKIGSWREAKKSNREEKEKFKILFSNFERRKRNQKFLSPVSRGKREILKNMLNFREEKEKWIFYSQASRRERESENNFSVFEKRKGNFKCCSPILRRE